MSTREDLSQHTHPKHYTRLKPEPWDVMLEFKLNGVQSLALKYLLRAGEKDGEPRVKDYAKTIACLEKLMEVNPPPKEWGDPPRTLEAFPTDLIGALPKRLTGWILPIPILLILRWLFDAWMKKSTINHRAAVAELEKLMEEENAVVR